MSQVRFLLLNIFGIAQLVEQQLNRLLSFRIITLLIFMMTDELNHWILFDEKFYWFVAQMVEPGSLKPGVVSSSLTGPTLSDGVMLTYQNLDLMTQVQILL